uniref:Uncharacterized protein n=1 Tax=Setaria italica TaxID=4555 RepID=K3ZAS1_SETIT
MGVDSRDVDLGSCSIRLYLPPQAAAALRWALSGAAPTRERKRPRGAMRTTRCGSAVMAARPLSPRRDACPGPPFCACPSHDVRAASPPWHGSPSLRRAAATAVVRAAAKHPDASGLVTESGRRVIS